MNWAIDSTNAETVYVDGRLAATKEEAEAYYRKQMQLYFLPVTVRRTTTEEDKRLQADDAH